MKAPSNELIYILAAHWKKDHRTIKAWFEDKNPMLEHRESIKIITDFNAGKPTIVKSK